MVVLVVVGTATAAAGAVGFPNPATTFVRRRRLRRWQRVVLVGAFLPSSSSISYHYTQYPVLFRLTRSTCVLYRYIFIDQSATY